MAVLEVTITFCVLRAVANLAAMAAEKLTPELFAPASAAFGGRLVFDQLVAHLLQREVSSTTNTVPPTGADPTVQGFTAPHGRAAAPCRRSNDRGAERIPRTTPRRSSDSSRKYDLS